MCTVHRTSTEHSTQLTDMQNDAAVAAAAKQIDRFIDRAKYTLPCSQQVYSPEPNERSFYDYDTAHSGDHFL